MLSIADHLAAVTSRIARAARAAGRDPSQVRLVAASKAVSIAGIEAAHAAGQRDFAESYVQEAVGKIEALAALRASIIWHFIGPLQANKARQVAECFDWVHGIDRMRIAQRLSDLRPDALPPLQVCIQVNIDGEATKSGVAPEEVLALARQVAVLPRLQLRGLMAIPAPSDTDEARRRPFAGLAALAGQLRADGLDVDTLSMGMSDDLEAAIAEGSSMVRVGTAIFGARGA